MIFLDDNHQPPGAFIVHDGQSHSTEALMATNALSVFAMLGYKPHITAEGPAPLGYTDWELRDGAYHREPAGTKAEREAALLNQAREQMSCTRLQAKRALARLGLAQSFLDYRAALATDPVANFEALAFIDDAQTWWRLDPRFNDAADAMGKTEEEKDAFFALAVTL